ncbi:MAG: glycosyltransferase [bacterium]|nr:glycosyltransferase [bacterium]
MTRILFIAPGDNSHTWKWVGWYGQRYPGEISLLPYQAPAPQDMMPGVKILDPFIPQFIISSLASWTDFARVKKIVREINPKLLHVLWAYGSGTYGARSDYKPTILSPWGSDITIFPESGGLKGLVQKKLIVEALSKADYLCATSKFLAGAIHDLVPQKPMPDIFPYGVNTSVFDPDKVAGKMDFDWQDGAPLGDRTITVGFFKALKPKYGPEFLIDAIAIASRKIPGVRCVMAGSGEMKDELYDRARKLEIEDRIIFPGRIPYIDMPKALNSIDIFAMPSRYEELGVAALEASAMRKPVIVTDRWGMKEVMVEGKTGYFIGVGDSEKLAEYIIKLSNDPQLRVALGNAGRKFVQENYEFEKIMLASDEYASKIIQRHER